MTGIENVIQNAIIVALQTHFDRDPNAPRFEAFPPVAVQQGSGIRKYCGDVIARLGDSRIIVLEIKELHVPSGVLKEFDADQYASCLAFENLGVPIAYAYNIVDPLPYNAPVFGRDWPTATLSSVKRSIPSELPGASPNIPQHQTLLDWLNDVTTTGEAPVSAALGRVHKMFERAHELRNGALVLIHSVSDDTLRALTPEQLEKVVKVLKRDATILPRGQAVLQSFLAGEASVFAGFVQPPPQPTASSAPAEAPRPGGGRGGRGGSGGSRPA